VLGHEGAGHDDVFGPLVAVQVHEYIDVTFGFEFTSVGTDQPDGAARGGVCSFSDFWTKG
jgi:hypothetical protein